MRPFIIITALFLASFIAKAHDKPYVNLNLALDSKFLFYNTETPSISTPE